jgi:hypothetical protein
MQLFVLATLPGWHSDCEARKPNVGSYPTAGVRALANDGSRSWTHAISVRNLRNCASFTKRVCKNEKLVYQLTVSAISHFERAHGTVPMGKPSVYVDMQN